ncbi:MAG: DUF922 domain-containing protein [Gemmatimonadetes bacterium]|nr:DUF922 domain-containing protein [Gemmatimonadota bacterium]
MTPGVYQTFDVDSLADLVDVASGKEPAAATIDYDMRFDRVDNRVTAVDLTISLNIDMPEWSKAGRRPKPEQDEWERFRRALRFHEDGHIKIYRREAAVMYKKLLATTVQTINTVFTNEKLRIKGLSKQFDALTGQGTKQKDCPDGTTIIKEP